MVTINVEMEDKPTDFNLNSFIDHIDPVVWDTVSHNEVIKIQWPG